MGRDPYGVSLDCRRREADSQAGAKWQIVASRGARLGEAPLVGAGIAEVGVTHHVRHLPRSSDRHRETGLNIRPRDV